MSKSIPENIQNIQERLSQVEERFFEMGNSMKTIVKSEIHSAWKNPAQQEVIYGMHTGICISTIDP